MSAWQDVGNCKKGDPLDAFEVLAELQKERERSKRLLEAVDWIRQTVHRAHHEGNLEDCEKNTCAYAIGTLREYGDK